MQSKGEPTILINVSRKFTEFRIIYLSQEWSNLYDVWIKWQNMLFNWIFP